MLSASKLVFWNKMKIKKWKTKILFFNFQIKIENWKLKIKNFFSISNLESKLKFAKMSFSISILNWKLNGIFGARIPRILLNEMYFKLNFFAPKKSVHRNCHSIFILKLEWKRKFLGISISIQNWNLKNDKKFSIFNFQFLLGNWKLKIHYSFFNFWI